ncbi:methionine--tRNA ligase [Candidatus Woesearchaeota archaeon]|nr:methionine--tRNA ligase [Candidatus Woesearchaeota archaeon]
MPKSKKKILVTSALPYVNNIPHLGTIVGCVLSADVYARAMKLLGREVLYICGTDEHGTATEVKAIEEGLTPQQICDKYFKIHKEVYDWFNIKFDYFGRTSKKNHHAITQEIFKKVEKNGYITEEDTEQVYCKQCDKFLADRFVEGKCPYCGYVDARGDQCDSCGKLLNPTELLSPRCSVHGTRPEIRKSKHLFLELEKLQPQLEKWAAKQSKAGNWTENAIQMTNAWFKEGLKKRAITRDLKWGIPVPCKGFENKVFYVWFDAPIGYISITEDLLKEKYKDWWYNPEKVELIQFMGKDNIPFHSIIFPGSLMATKDKFTFVHTINSTEFLNYEGGKFSKSKGVGVFGNDAMASGIPADVYRYYLMMNRPETSDSEFKWEQFKDRLNNELVGNFGNLVNRTLVFIKKFYDKKIEDVKLDKESKDLWEVIVEEEKKAVELLNKIKLRDALKQIMMISNMGNEYFQKREPWKQRTENENKCKASMLLLVNMIKDLAILTEPFMPLTSEKIFLQLGIKKRDFSDLGKMNVLTKNKEHKINEPEVLFKKMEDKEMTALREKFAGKQSAQDEFSKLDLVVGEIVAANKHKDADKLMIEEVDIGTERRIILSGIAQHYKPEDIVGKKVILIKNLKPAMIRGHLSKGMLLAAGKGKEVKVLEAPKSKPGDKVYAEGIEPKPEKEITIDLFSKIKIKTKNGKVVYGTSVLKTDKEEIVPGIDDGAEVR